MDQRKINIASRRSPPCHVPFAASQPMHWQVHSHNYSVANLTAQPSILCRPLGDVIVCTAQTGHVCSSPGTSTLRPSSTVSFFSMHAASGPITANLHISRHSSAGHSASMSGTLCVPITVLKGGTKFLTATILLNSHLYLWDLFDSSKVFSC
jgi:hypothetical protein